MSEVDTRFGPAEREALLAEIRAYLPAFLSPSATEQPDPLGDVKELLNLESADTDRLTSVHVLLTDPVREFIASVHEGLRRPVTSSVRPKEPTQAVRGAIDWQATLAHRGMAGGDPSLYVIRPARRIFDTPENRALLWAFQRIDRAMRSTGSTWTDGESADDNAAGWTDALAKTQSALAAAARVPWLREVSPERPTAFTRRRLASNRTRFYAQLLPGAIEAIERWTENPSADDLTELLCQRWFRPQRDWQLFELVVSLRISRALAEKSPAPRRSRLLVGGPGARQPFGRYGLADGSEVRLWYQAWPNSSGPSHHQRARVRHKLASGPPRPDLVIERTAPAPDSVVLEMKASRSPGYLGSGLSQLLGYLAERPEMPGVAPRGWLVAPAAGPFSKADADPDEPLWMVAADEVATRSVERFA